MILNHNIFGHNIFDVLAMKYQFSMLYSVHVIVIHWSDLVHRTGKTFWFMLRRIMILYRCRSFAILTQLDGNVHNSEKMEFVYLQCAIDMDHP